MNNNINKTLFILDWDDTLFPTNWVLNNGIKLALTKSHDQYMMYFQELDRILSKFLKRIICLGKVIIVTNAMLEWVKISSIILPNTTYLLKKVTIISAREKYRNKSNNIWDWKKMAFKDVIDIEFNKESIINVISVGDAEYEYQALIALNKKKGTKYLKSIKFVKEPSHDILIDQLEVLNIAIPNIWNKQKHMDLKFKL